MKKYFSVLYIMIYLLSIHAQQTELQKIDDFLISQHYIQRDNVIAEDGFLYTLSAYGLEIYEIDIDGELTLQSRTPTLVSNSIKKKDNYIYISSGHLSASNFWGKLYQINVMDKQNPVIEQELEYVYFSWPLEIYGDKLNIQLFNPATQSFYNLFYSLPDLSLITQFQNFFYHIDKFNDAIAIRFDGYNQFTVFDISDIISPEIIGTGDVSSIHQFDIHRVTAYQDTILICSNFYGLSFWNVSDWNNWEYLTQYSLQSYLFNDFQPLIIDTLMILVEFGYVELVNLANIDNPEQLCLLSGTADRITSAYVAAYYDFFYVTTNYNGIQILKQIDNTLSFENEYAEYYFAQKTMLKDNFIITSHPQNSYQIYDFSDPNNPIDNGEFIPLYNPFFETSGNRLAVFQEDTYNYDIFDITDLSNPTITNHIECNYYNICRFDQTDQNSVYFVDTTYHLRKFDISIPGINNLLIDEWLNFEVYNCIIHDGVGYFLVSSGSSEKSLYVIEGLNENQPVLANIVNSFVRNPYAYLKIIDNMLVIYSDLAQEITPINSTKFFNLENPSLPVLDFELNTFGQPFIKNNLIFTGSSYECYIFEKNNNPTGVLEPFYTFSDISIINEIHFMEYNNEDYLILREASHTAVYSYIYTPSAADDEISLPVFTLSNHPNPFNPSTEIRFQMSEVGESAEVVIYNIKGQKVKILDCSNSFAANSRDSCSHYSLIWDGTDQNNQRVSTGVYLYQLQVEGKPVASRKMMMLK